MKKPARRDKFSPKSEEKIRKDIFVLVIGHGRSGTSLTAGSINLLDDMQLAFERNQSIINRLSASDVPIEKVRKLKERKPPYHFNGNKIAFGAVRIRSDVVITCIEEKFGIIHDRYEKIKFIFVHRNPIDNVYSQFMRNTLNGKVPDNEETAINKVQVWLYNRETLRKLRTYAEKEWGEYFEFDFYDFIRSMKVRQRMFQFLGEKWEVRFNVAKIRTVMYGKAAISAKRARYVGATGRQDVKDWIVDEFRRNGYDYKGGSI